MAKDKTSFILYSDLITVVKKLVERDRIDNTNNAGELFLHILDYVNDNEPIPVNFIIDMAFEPIKLSLKRDLKKYEVYIEKQRVNGLKGGRPKNPKEIQKTQPFLNKPKKADSDSDSDSVNDIEVVVDTDDGTFKINQLYDRFVQEVKEGKHSQAIERMYINLKLRDGSLTPLIKEFNGNLIISNKLHKNIGEFKIHFNSWLNKLDSIGKLSEYKKTKSVGAL